MTYQNVVMEKQHWYIELGWYSGSLGPPPAFTTEWLHEHDHVKVRFMWCLTQQGLVLA